MVGHTVKVDKEQEVGTQQGTSEQGRSFGTSAAASVGQVRPVSVGKVSVGAKVDDKQINDELSDLHGSKVTLPPDLGASSGAEVVVVHQDMDSQVKSDRNPGLQAQQS